ncbi:MAG: hypothetical protein GAK28_04954 [Luteibacter sp.]|nr:MAG: hypothetical protein GAK28_04954 [Luteibacter sp.]
MPETGSQRSCTPKIHISSSPDQNTGKLCPIWIRNIAA